jgi:glutathione-S-conjugate glycine hydrolase
MKTLYESDTGQKMLQENLAIHYKSLRDNWVAQLKSHCGAASAVVVMNSLQNEEVITQDGLFITETSHIITQDVVFKIGFTLEELSDIISTRSKLKTEFYHAGNNEDQFVYEKFLEDLKKNRRNSDQRMIILYSRAFTNGEGEGKGHFSPVWDYNEDEDKILILEINRGFESFWIRSRDMWNAMNTVDPACGKHRGWLIVKK